MPGDGAEGIVEACFRRSHFRALSLLLSPVTWFWVGRLGHSPKKCSCLPARLHPFVLAPTCVLGLVLVLARLCVRVRLHGSVSSGFGSVGHKKVEVYGTRRGGSVLFLAPLPQHLLDGSIWCRLFVFVVYTRGMV